MQQRNAQKSKQLFLIPDRFKTQGMCIKGVEVDPWQLYNVPDHFKTQEMCDKAVREDAFSLQHLPDCFVRQGQVKIWNDYYDKAVARNPYTLRFVPDWFLTQQQAKIWDDYCDNDRLIEWYGGYQKKTVQKAQIKEELMLIAWHPSR